MNVNVPVVIVWQDPISVPAMRKELSAVAPRGANSVVAIGCGLIPDKIAGAEQF